MNRDYLDEIASFFYQDDGQGPDGRPEFKLTEPFRELSKPIKRRVPLHFFEQWYEYLRAVCNEKWDSHKVAEVGADATRDKGIAVFQNICSAAIRSNLPQPLNPWTRAILIITAEAFCGSLDIPCSHSFLRFVLSDDEKAYDYRILATDLKQLYAKEAQTELAGPLGFYCLARTTLLLRPVVAKEVFIFIDRHTPIDNYFHLLRNSSGEEVRRQPGPGAPDSPASVQVFPLPELKRDRCYIKLVEMVRPARELKPENNVIKAVDIISAFDRSKLRLGLYKKPPEQEKEKVRILIIGKSGSGKTTIIDQLHKAVKQHVSFGEVIISPSANIDEIRWRVKEGRKFPPQSTQDMIVYEGKVHLRGRNIDFQIVDSKGGLLDTPRPKADTDVKDWPLLYREAVKANLIILVVPADYFDSEHYDENMLQYLKNHVLDLPDYKPQAMVAIAYSKCDEFGVTMKGNHRVIETPQDRAKFETFRRASSSEDASAWKDFLDEVAGSEQVLDDSVRLRRYLMEETRELWDISNARGLSHKFINGYFVSAQPVLPKKNEIASDGGLRRGIPIDWAARGFPLLFADFFYHIEHMRGPL